MQCEMEKRWKMFTFISDSDPKTHNLLKFGTKTVFFLVKFFFMGRISRVFDTLHLPLLLDWLLSAEGEYSSQIFVTYVFESSESSMRTTLDRSCSRWPDGIFMVWLERTPWTCNTANITPVDIFWKFLELDTTCKFNSWILTFQILCGTDPHPLRFRAKKYRIQVISKKTPFLHVQIF